MIRIILCEGKTDAILLSYYLGRTKGWEYDKKPNHFKLQVPESDNRFVGHYKNGTEKLSICAVGGKDNFVNFYKENVEEYIKGSESLDLNYKLAIVVDRDDKTTEEIEQYFSDNLKPCIDQIADGVWTSNSFVNNFGQEATIEKLCLIIPHENQGALENLLMEALSEDTYKKNLINKSQSFVDEIAPEAAKIISTERLKLKTKLGVSLAVLYPEKVFSLIDEQLKSVSWEKSEILSKTFKTLIEI